ncbi:MAG: hypothetical protein AB9836_06155 [Aminipila sp.]
MNEVRQKAEKILLQQMEVIEKTSCPSEKEEACKIIQAISSMLDTISRV